MLRVQTLARITLVLMAMTVLKGVRHLTACSPVGESAGLAFP